MIKNAKFSPPLLIYILTNTVEDFTIIHLQLNYINVLKVVKLNDLSNKVCIPNKTEDLNLSVFYTILVINELKTLTRHISCECKYKFDGTKCKSS